MVTPGCGNRRAVEAAAPAHEPMAWLPCSQGGWETDEDVEAAAARETVEEAGVRGRLEASASWHRLPN
jgi:hypothetical protein